MQTNTHVQLICRSAADAAAPLLLLLLLQPLLSILFNRPVFLLLNHLGWVLKVTVGKMLKQDFLQAR